MNGHDTDTGHMGVALDLAVRGWGHVSPNPMVGALVVADDEVLGRGWYEGPSGAPHAEVRALREAGDRARGATIVCTLEPCNHHGATPPCTEALIDAGVARVVVGATDPNPLVDGTGLARLRAAGLDVRDGVLAAEAHRLNAAFERHVMTGTPFVIWKVATSLDGKTAARDGSSRWITSEDARRRPPPACVGGRDRRRRRHGPRRRPGAHRAPSGFPTPGRRSASSWTAPAVCRRPRGLRRKRAHARRDDGRRRARPRPCAPGRGRGRGVRRRRNRRRGADGPARRAREARRARCRAGRRCDPRVELPARRRRRSDRAIRGASPDRRRRGTGRVWGRGSPRSGRPRR